MMRGRRASRAPARTVPPPAPAPRGRRRGEAAVAASKRADRRPPCPRRYRKPRRQPVAVEQAFRREQRLQRQGHGGAADDSGTATGSGGRDQRANSPAPRGRNVSSPARAHQHQPAHDQCGGSTTPRSRAPAAPVWPTHRPVDVQRAAKEQEGEHQFIQRGGKNRPGDKRRASPAPKAIAGRPDRA